MRKNEIMHENEIRYVKLSIGVYGVKISEFGLGDLS